MSNIRKLALIISFFCSISVFSQDKVVTGVISRYDESNVVLAPDGNTLYFTFSNHVLNRGGKMDKGDIWYSTHLGDSGWSAPMRIIGPINNHLNNRVLGFSPDGRIMYLHGQYGKGSKAASTNGISMSKWNGRMWTDPVSLDIPYFKNESFEQGGYISPDGEILLLSIDSYNSKGNEDIYVSFNRDGKWSEPLNLGETINTPYQEFTPYLSNNKSVLFFSSNGREGEGSSDIYFSERLSDTWIEWSVPENLGKAYNGPGKDYNFFMVDHMRKVLWVSLTNSDQYGEIKIAEPLPSFDSLFTERTQVPVIVVQNEPDAEEVPEELPFEGIVPLKGRVTDQAGLPLEGVTVSLSYSGNKVEVNTDENGRYKFTETINAPGLVRVSVPSYIPQNEQVKLTGTATRELNFSMLPIEVGITVNLKNVLFQRGTANFLPGSAESLETVVELMKSNPALKIELGGHTDNTGIAKKNAKLSKKRVNTVKKYLVKQGIESKRIEGVGYGGDKPIASNATEASRKLNRRVEFTILEN